MVEASIILRTKNEEKWVGECLKRLFSQTYKNFEIIVIDSGAIVRRGLWDQYRFPEEYAFGGEDSAWGRYWLSKGYIAIRDYRFSVYHSHGLGIVGLVRQWLMWRSLSKPQTFKRLEFRK